MFFGILNASFFPLSLHISEIMPYFAVSNQISGIKKPPAFPLLAIFVPTP